MDLLKRYFRQLWIYSIIFTFCFSYTPSTSYAGIDKETDCRKNPSSEICKKINAEDPSSESNLQAALQGIFLIIASIDTIFSTCQNAKLDSRKPKPYTAWITPWLARLASIIYIIGEIYGWVTINDLNQQVEALKKKHANDRTPTEFHKALIKLYGSDGKTPDLSTGQITPISGQIGAVARKEKINKWATRGFQMAASFEISAIATNLALGVMKNSVEGTKCTKANKHGIQVGIPAACAESIAEDAAGNKAIDTVKCEADAGLAIGIEEGQKQATKFFLVEAASMASRANAVGSIVTSLFKSVFSSPDVGAIGQEAAKQSATCEASKAATQAAFTTAQSICCANASAECTASETGVLAVASLGTLPAACAAAVGACVASGAAEVAENCWCSVKNSLAVPILINDIKNIYANPPSSKPPKTSSEAEKKEQTKALTLCAVDHYRWIVRTDRYNCHSIFSSASNNRPKNNLIDNNIFELATLSKVESDKLLSDLRSAQSNSQAVIIFSNYIAHLRNEMPDILPPVLNAPIDEMQPQLGVVLANLLEILNNFGDMIITRAHAEAKPNDFYKMLGLGVGVSAAVLPPIQTLVSQIMNATLGRPITRGILYESLSVIANKTNKHLSGALSELQNRKMIVEEELAKFGNPSDLTFTTTQPNKRENKERKSNSGQSQLDDIKFDYKKVQDEINRVIKPNDWQKPPQEMSGEFNFKFPSSMETGSVSTKLITQLSGGNFNQALLGSMPNEMKNAASALRNSKNYLQQSIGLVYQQPPEVQQASQKFLASVTKQMYQKIGKDGVDALIKSKIGDSLIEPTATSDNNDNEVDAMTSTVINGKNDKNKNGDDLKFLDQDNSEILQASDNQNSAELSPQDLIIDQQDVNKNPDVSIFKIITARYIRSYPRLSGKESTITIKEQDNKANKP